MPRDTAGVYTPPRDWVADAAGQVPFDPAKWNQQDIDFAQALNDLPLKSKVPVWSAPGTDPATVNPGSLMDEAGITYVRPADPIWIDISSTSIGPQGPQGAAGVIGGVDNRLAAEIIGTVTPVASGTVSGAARFFSHRLQKHGHFGLGAMGAHKIL